MTTLTSPPPLNSTLNGGAAKGFHFRAIYFGHMVNAVNAFLILGTGGAQSISLGVLRAMYMFSVAVAIWTMYGKRRNALYLARTVLLILPGYFAAAVQLWEPALYYSIYERVSQTLDITMTMYALSSLALLGSELGLWRGSIIPASPRGSYSFSDDFFFYFTIIPFFLVSYYVSLMYGKSLFEASYASTSGVGGLGVTTAIAIMLSFILFQNYLINPRPVKAVMLVVALSFFLIFCVLIRGGRQDVLSCLFGLFVIYWAQKKKTGAPITRRFLVAGAVGYVFMSYFGFIRGNVLGAGFGYVDYFYEFVKATLHPGEVVSLGTISPVASTFSNTIYALKVGITPHIWGKGYWEYILRTPPEFLYPDRPADYAWIFLDWKLSAGGGFFELAEAYLNLGILGAIFAPMAVSFVIARVFSRYLRDGRMLDSFLLFGILSIFLRGCLYQTFAFYKAELTGVLLMLVFGAVARLRSSGRAVSLDARDT